MRRFPTEEVPDRTNFVTNEWLKQSGSRLDPWRVFVREGPPSSRLPEVYARGRDLDNATVPATPNDDIPL